MFFQIKFSYIVLVICAFCVGSYNIKQGGMTLKTVYILLALALVLMCIGVSTASPIDIQYDDATIALSPTPEVSTFCRDVSQPNVMNDYLLNANVDLASLYATMSPARPIHYPIAQIATNANTRWKVNADIWNGVRESKPLTVL